MFGNDRHNSIIQRGIHEALACQDILARAPAQPTLFTRVLDRLTAAVRVRAPWTRHRPPRVTPAPPLKLSR